VRWGQRCSWPYRAIGSQRPDIRPDKPGVSRRRYNERRDPDRRAPDPFGCPPTWRGAPMVDVPAPDGLGYCIDSREVSQGDYFEFLDAFTQGREGHFWPKVDGGGWARPPGCRDQRSHHPTFRRSRHVLLRVASIAISRDNAYPHLPVTCVDWCDAYAYCAWAGKRCAGEWGGPLLVSEVADPKKAGGTTRVPGGKDGVFLWRLSLSHPNRVFLPPLLGGFLFPVNVLR